MAENQRGIQTVEVSGEILKLVCSSYKPLSLSEIAERVSMAPGSAYKYLNSLLKTGLLKRNESTLEYEAGPLSLRLGLAKINHEPLLIKSRAYLTKAAEKLKINVFASVWSNINGPTVVFYKEYGGFFNLGFRLGNTLSLRTTATGRLFAAFKPLDSIVNHIDDINNFNLIINELDEIKRVGYSKLSNIPTPGFTSFAVPVFDQNKNIILSLTAFGLTQEIDSAKAQSIVNVLMEIANNLQETNHG